MKAAEALIAANVGGPVEVGPLIGEGTGDWVRARGYDLTLGAAWVDRRSMKGAAQRLRVFIDFLDLVVSFKVPVEQVHAAMLRVDEYRDLCREWGIAPPGWKWTCDEHGRRKKQRRIEPEPDGNGLRSQQRGETGARHGDRD